MYTELHVNTHYSCQILNRLGIFCGKFSENYGSTKFHENPPSENRVVPYGRTDGKTDMTKIVVSVLSFGERA